MADEGFDYSDLVDGDADADDKLFIDLDTVLNVLDEDCDPSESSLEGFSLKNVSPGESSIHDNFQLQSGNSMLCCDHENQGPPSQTCSSSHAVPDGFQQLDPLDGSNEICYTEREGTSGCEVPAQSLEPSAPEPHFNNTSVCGDNLNLNPLWKEKKESQLKHVGEDVKSEYASYSPMIENSDVSFAQYGAFDEDMCEGVSGQPESDSCTSFEMSFMDANGGSHIGTSTNSTICRGFNALGDSRDYFSSLHGYKGTDDRLLPSDLSLASYLPNVSGSQFWPNQEILDNVKGENMEYVADASRVSSNMHSSSTGGISFQDNQFLSADSEFSSFFPGNVSYYPCEEQVARVKGERDQPITPYQNSLFENYSEFNGGQEMNQLKGGLEMNQLNSAFPSMGNYGLNLLECEAKDADVLSNIHHYQGMIDGTGCKFLRDTANLNRQALNKSLPYTQASIGTEEQFGYVKNEGEEKMIQCRNFDSHISKAGAELVHSNFLEKSHVEDDDSDVCVIESISHPAPVNRSTDHWNSHKISQYSPYGDSQPCMSRSTRSKAFDEQYVLRAALQDLSQPKSEVIPPDGLMAVPLLRHQRIALSWMVQKETSSLYCSGGILADDQGLGKTVSTIALILKERPPALIACQNPQKGELETLNLDVDDDVLAEGGGVKEDRPSVSPIENKNLLMQTKGRPSAGTLIVCPTSVLRQWAEELQNKVTSKANLSVLVYHGSNRTKDPYMLAKYDVVLTTYSIVSMEVPKQPLVDKDEEEKGKSDVHAGLPPSKKRKCPSSSRSGKKGLDHALLEVSARPLAKVAWFRVVLDEAQSIKNHRTQVARACWGLRAKRRWCLSGTPIQNAIDDLYSYFRFLRYDPYAIYNTFCSTIKIPINRNPNRGYRKLQAVLKTIMLRRTKGTLLDGEPIITLPPKYVQLKKVDFSREERDFYSRLEADSRAQFQEYANAGTVKENYVNILLMLLRLRQACDHPLLVKRYNSNSLWRSSVEMAKKLPWEKRTSLFNCLEASLAICGICNDPPEEAVVSSCGHVFCNQCISEHLTGDDNQCPTTNCKAQLSMSSVFSRAALNCSLSDQASNSLVDCSGSEVEGYEPCSQSQPIDSSKIKAALEVLNSLCKPQVNASKSISMQTNSDEHSDSHGNSSDANEVKSFKDFPESQNMSDGSSNDSIVREKAIVFSQWTRMLDLLEACLKNSSIQYRRLDGTMSVVARDKAVKDFNTLPEVTVMIMSLKAASLGLNMVAACHVLLLDLWWNPTTEDQAIDRAHRIGQTRPVTVLRLTVRDTVEDRILALQQKKRKMVASAFGEDETGGRQSRLTVDDLKYLFMM
ncbi:helicase-like transcription factor CHR28 [Neltuma alba]|uniref:helicase-like transcription factor CHR28 n=1 Tax=Neltuma alba TaxID=207710 RepID=UPI0010A43FBD|nr:helicase-like transcription factor CHR28 [Prosopis alba]